MLNGCWNELIGEKCKQYKIANCLFTIKVQWDMHHRLPISWAWSSLTIRPLYTVFYWHKIRHCLWRSNQYFIWSTWCLYNTNISWYCNPGAGHLRKASCALTSCFSVRMHYSQASSFESPPLSAEVLYWHEHCTNTCKALKSSHLDLFPSATS